MKFENACSRLCSQGQTLQILFVEKRRVATVRKKSGKSGKKVLVRKSQEKSRKNVKSQEKSGNNVKSQEKVRKFFQKVWKISLKIDCVTQK